MTQHLHRLGVAQALSLESGKIVAQACILSFHPSHGCFTHEMVTIINAAGIDRPTISDVEEAMPASNHQPQRPKGLQVSLTQRPGENASSFAIDGSPQPDFVFFDPQRCEARRVGLGLEPSQMQVHRAIADLVVAPN